MSEIKNQPGLIDAADRVLQELVKSPKFKEKVGLLLRSLDSHSAPGLIQTLVWADPVFFLSIIGAAPEMINICIRGGDELLAQLEKLPPAVLGGFLAEFIDRLDGEAAGSAISRGLSLYRNVANLKDEPFKESWTAFGEKVERGWAGEGAGRAEVLLSLLQPLLQERIARLAKDAAEEGTAAHTLIRGLAGAISEAVEANPNFMEHVYRPLAEAFLGAAGGNSK
ncbi:MAG: hypothetical protein GX881_01040 [Firmicutes bacterium]|nr:hypothetical protein [Bacillota bacterium]